ncbi:MAG: WD40 repeat domain-containing protein [Pirellulales bacterium]|nr:WD40 repeat domain-containing protein [Pirellulales bacterium]
MPRHRLVRTTADTGRPIRASWLAGLLVLLAASCHRAERDADTAVLDDFSRFAREAFVLRAGEHVESAETEMISPTTHVDRSRQLLWSAWTPGAKYTIVGEGTRRELIAPQLPTPYRLRRVKLGDVAAAAAAGVTPDGVVKFAPDGRRLALGTFDGALVVLDAYSGEVLFRHRASEGMVKSLAWSPDGRWLYAGEQSPDAYLLAIDTGAVRSATESAGQASNAANRYAVAWRYRFADRIETSRPIAGDRYAIYTLPAVHDLHVSTDGRVFAAATHNWTRHGELANRTVLACFAPDGHTHWTLPRVAAWQFTVAHFDIDRAGRRMVCLPNRTQAAATSADVESASESIAPGDFYLIDALGGEILDRQRLEPFAPHFSRVESWDSVALSDDGSRAAAGLVDGRVVLSSVADDRFVAVRTFELGAPRLVGGLPVAAACSYTRFCGAMLVMQTQNTHIPFGNPQAANQAPSPHPGANCLTVADFDGQEVWKYQGPFAISGAWSDATGRWLMVACRELPGADEPGQYGFLVFDTLRAGGGADKLVYYYATTGPVIFNADLSADGRLAAVVEVPAPTSEGRDLYGEHQLHIVH